MGERSSTGAADQSHPVAENGAHARHEDEREAAVETDSSRSRADSSDVEKQSQKNVDDLELVKSQMSIADTMSPFREILFVGTVCLAQAMTQVGLGQTLSSLHYIGDSFGITNDGQLGWLIAGYSLTVGTFILISGRLGDLFGYKKMFLIGFWWYALWSMVAGLAVYSNHVLFIFARVFSGIGPSLTLPNALAILGSTYNPGRKKNLAFALFGAVAPGGSILGAATGGLFAQLVWWPWAFWSTAITLACIAAASQFILPPAYSPKREHKMTWQEFVVEADVVGGVLGVTALVLINFAWNQAVVAGWAHAYICVCLVLGIMMVPGFFWYEFKIAKHPLVPFDVINAEVGFVLGCISCGWGCFGIWIFYTFQFFEQSRGATPMQAAAWFSPAAGMGFAAAFSTAWLLGRVQPAVIMAISMSAFLTGITLITTAPVSQTYWTQTFIMTLIMTFGMDMSFPSGTLILSNAVPKEHQGVGASLVNTCVNYSISIALGIAGTVERNIRGDDRSSEGLLRGFRSAFYLGIGLAATGLALSLIFLGKSYWRR